MRLNAEVKKCLLALLLHFPDKALPEYKELGDRTRKANHTAIILEDEAWDIRQLLISLAVRYGADSPSPN